MNFLEGMIERRKARMVHDFGHLRPDDLERIACCARPVRDFGTALRDRLDVAVIAEVKKASPSAGPIAVDCEASKQALHYQDGGAAAISVLTEPESFGGSFVDLSDVSDAVDVPVLCKDFVVGHAQLFLARGYGADAVLLMVSVLGEALGGFMDLAQTLNLAPLVEVVDERELTIARKAGADLIAVNSRDLRTLAVDRAGALATVRAAADAGATVVSASGVTSRDDVEAASEAGASAVLVGEMLMRAPFPEDLLEGLTGVPRRASQERKSHPRSVQ